MNSTLAEITEEEDDIDSVTSEPTVGWKLPEVEFTVKFPGWFIVMVTLLIFRGGTPKEY
jgi:hypothetical protein